MSNGHILNLEIDISNPRINIWRMKFFTWIQKLLFQFQYIYIWIWDWYLSSENCYLNLKLDISIWKYKKSYNKWDSQKNN
jgi:hypothetical protein